MCTTLDFYIGMMEVMSDDVLGDILGVNEGQLIDLFSKTFGPKYLYNFQKTLACLCYRSALLVCRIKELVTMWNM